MENDFAVHVITEPDLVVAERILHLVDVENLVGRAGFSIPEAAGTYAAYDRVAPKGTINQIVVATSHHAAAPTWFGWPANARRLVRSGENGADLALLEVVEREAVAARFEHVVIGSGDGIFAFAAARLQAAGCAVTVVTRRTGLSRQVRFAVRDVRFIDPVPVASTIGLEMGIA